MALRRTGDTPPVEVDIDALFAPESDVVRDAAQKELPGLIFTQAADRGHQFEDESDDEDAANASSFPAYDASTPLFAEEPVYFVEQRCTSETLLPHEPGAPPPPFVGATPVPPPPTASTLLRRRLAAAAALTGVVTVLIAVLMATARRNEPPGDAPPQPPGQSAVSEASPARATESSTPAVGAPPTLNPAFSPPPAAAVAALTTPRRAPGNARPTNAPTSSAGGAAGREGPLTPSGSLRNLSSGASAPAAAARPALPPAGPSVDGPTARMGASLAPPEVQRTAAAALPDRPLRTRGDSAAASSALPGTGVRATPLDAATGERNRVRALLTRYQNAYSDLDAAAAANLYSRIDRRELSRTFAALSSQRLRFDDCDIRVATTSARATCAGSTTWTPKVGRGSRSRNRQWQFDLQQVAGEWRIAALKVR